MDVHESLLEGKFAELAVRDKLPNYGEFIGEGKSGSVYKYSDSKVIKIQEIQEKYKEVLTESDFYEVLEGDVFIKDMSLMEVLVMQKLSTSPIIPKAYDYGLVRVNGTWISYIIMDIVRGIEYSNFLRIKKIQGHRSLYLKMWFRLLEAMKRLWENNNFIHGDLTRFNMFVDTDSESIRLIDFARSTFSINGQKFFAIYIINQHDLIEGLDICKLLQYYRESGSKFSDKFENLLDSCTNIHGETRPAVVHDCSRELTYSVALSEIRTTIDDLYKQ